MALMMAAILRGERGHRWGPVVAAGTPAYKGPTFGTIIATVAIFSSGGLVELRQVLRIIFDEDIDAYGDEDSTFIYS